jgi:hypothetical protein
MPRSSFDTRADEVVVKSHSAGRINAWQVLRQQRERLNARRFDETDRSRLDLGMESEGASDEQQITASSSMLTQLAICEGPGTAEEADVSALCCGIRAV